jgi:hypothetical protein
VKAVEDGGLQLCIQRAALVRIRPLETAQVQTLHDTAKEEARMIAVHTFPPRFSRPKTATLPAAPRPRLPLRTPPK